MSVCRHCGQDIPEAADWHGLRVTAMGDVYWRGIKRIKLVPSHTALLLAMVRRGEATHLALEMAVAERSSNVVAVHITKIRKKLCEAGIPVVIQSIHGLGYRLVEKELH